MSADRELFVRAMSDAGHDEAEVREMLTRMDGLHRGDQGADPHGPDGRDKIDRWVDQLQEFATKHPSAPVSSLQFADAMTLLNALFGAVRQMNAVISAMNQKNAGRNERIDALEARLGGTAAPTAGDDDDLMRSTRELLERIEREG